MEGSCTSLQQALSVTMQCNIQTHSLVHLKDANQKVGCHPRWTIKSYLFTASRAFECLASTQLPPSVAQIVPASQADFNKLFEYGADMLGTSQACKFLLAAWLAHLHKSSWVAIDNTGKVVGYLIMSETTCFPEDGYCVAPFFADSAPIARSLLKMAVSFASANNPRRTLSMEIPVDYNLEGARIAVDELGAKPTQEILHMSRKEVTTKGFSKVFSHASSQVL